MRIAIILALILLTSARADEPCKPSIPDDTVLRCRDGRLEIYSESAQERMVFPVQCRPMVSTAL